MTIRLTVRTTMWRSHVASVAASVDGLVPVVKGNGYGFGRAALAAIAAEISDTIAVGTVHELDGLPDGIGDRVDVAVLTPTLTPPESSPDRRLVGHDSDRRQSGPHRCTRRTGARAAGTGSWSS